MADGSGRCSRSHRGSGPRFPGKRTQEGGNMDCQTYSNKGYNSQRARQISLCRYSVGWPSKIAVLLNFHLTGRACWRGAYCSATQCAGVTVCGAARTHRRHCDSKARATASQLSLASAGKTATTPQQPITASSHASREMLQPHWTTCEISSAQESGQGQSTPPSSTSSISSNTVITNH